MSSLFDPSSDDDPQEVDNPSNPGDDANFDAGDLHAENDAEAQAAADYDEQVGSDVHEQAVDDAREGAGFSIDVAED